MLFICASLCLSVVNFHSQKPIYAVVGPTASGKTELGVALALRIGGEIINCDSVQIYKEIQIATAKPSIEEMRGVPHHLIDYVSPDVNYTATDWAGDATEKIYEIEARGNTAILVGGTGFYLRALRQPFFESPKTNENLRNRLAKIKEEKGAEYLYKILRRVDKAAAKKVFPRDYVRVMRALEVYFQTGERLSELQLTREMPPEFADRIEIFALNPPRDLLYERINRRAEVHFQNGLVEEVKHLRERGVKDDTNALGAHGYRRVCEYLRDERTLESAVEQTRQDVRNYAKRQMSWFRHKESVTWLEGFGDDENLQKKFWKMLDEK